MTRVFSASKNHEALQEAGRYLSGKPLLDDGPQRQPAMDLPPSVLPLTGVLPLCRGVSEMLLADALVLPRSASWLPTTVITPFASELMAVTYLLVRVSQTLGNMAETSATEAELMASLTAVWQLPAASSISEALALML